MLELGKYLFDWVEIGTVGRKEQQPCASGPDRGPDSGLFVAGQIVEDDDVTWPQRRAELLLDPLGKACAIDWLIEHERRVDPVAAQGGDEGHRLPMAIRHLGVESLADRSPAPQRGHVGPFDCPPAAVAQDRLGPSFVHKDKASGVRPALELLPLLAPPGHLGPQLFGGKYAFLKLNPSAWAKRQT